MPNLSFELPVEDLRRASSFFYGQVSGWSMHHLPDVDYTLITASDEDTSGGNGVKSASLEEPS